MSSNKFKDIESSNSIHIDVIQYLSDHKNVVIEIGNITAGKDVNVSIEQYLTKSADFKLLQNQINKAKEKLNTIPIDDIEALTYCSKKITDLEKTLIDFKIDVIKMANIFSKIEVHSEQLRIAKKLFEEGRIQEANKALNPDDLKEDQIKLKAKIDENENERKILEKNITENAFAYLLKAKFTGIDWEETNRFDKTCSYFEASLRSKDSTLAHFEYGIYLQKNNRILDAEKQLNAAFQLFRNGQLLFSPDNDTKIDAGQLLKQALDASTDPLSISLNDGPDIHNQLGNLVATGLNTNEGIGYLEVALGLTESRMQEVLNTNEDMLRFFFIKRIKIYNNLAICYTESGNLLKAEENYELALEDLRKGFFACGVEYRVLATLKSIVLTNQSTFFRKQNRYGDAEQALALAAFKYEDLLSENEKVDIGSIASMYHHFFQLYYATKHHERAKKMLLISLDIFEQLSKINPSQYIIDYYSCLWNIAFFSKGIQEYESCKTYLQKSEVILNTYAEDLHDILGYRQLATNGDNSKLAKVEEAIPIRLNTVQSDKYYSSDSIIRRVLKELQETVEFYSNNNYLLYGKPSIQKKKKASKKGFWNRLFHW